MAPTYVPPVYECGGCGRDIEDHDLGIFNRHQGLHHGTKQFECQDCGDGFSDPKTLERHMGWHDDTRIHVCNKCGDALITDMGLISHRRTCGTDIDSKPLFCNHCGWRTANKQSIRGHVCPEALRIMNTTDGPDEFQEELAKASLTNGGVPLSTAYLRKPAESRQATAAGQQQAGLIPAIHRERPVARTGAGEQRGLPPTLARAPPQARPTTGAQEDSVLRSAGEDQTTLADRPQHTEDGIGADKACLEPRESTRSQVRLCRVSDGAQASLPAAGPSKPTSTAQQSTSQDHPSPYASQGLQSRSRERYAAPSVASSVAQWRPRHAMEGLFDSHQASSSQHPPSANRLAVAPADQLSSRHVSSPTCLARTLSAGRVPLPSFRVLVASTEQYSPVRQSIPHQSPAGGLQPSPPESGLPSIQALKLPKPPKRNSYMEDYPLRSTPIRMPPSNPALQQALGVIKRREGMSPEDFFRVVRPRPSPIQNGSASGPSQRHGGISHPPLYATPQKLPAMEPSRSVSLTHLPSLQSPRTPPPTRRSSAEFRLPTPSMPLPSVSALQLPLPNKRPDLAGPIPNTASLHPSLTSRQHYLASNKPNISSRQPVSYPPQRSRSASAQAVPYSSVASANCQACGFETLSYPTTKAAVDKTDKNRRCVCQVHTGDEAME